MSSHCGRCGAANLSGRRFCGACGAPLAVACADCGFANGADDAFCGGCGRRLGSAAPPVGGELREVVVLFADIEDFTGLSRRLEPEEVHRLLGRFFQVVDGTVSEFGGTVDKHIGDNLMALFGAPVAHGNDAERAVRAAVAIHAGVAGLGSGAAPALKVHVGVASGQVMASTLGSRHHQEYTVIGSSVNLAARLQGAAAGGETLVDESVYRAAAAVVAAEPVDELMLKGLGGPIRAWRILGLRQAPEAPLRPLIGRRAEWRRLEPTLRRCSEQGRGRPVVIRGEAGVGKSRLVDEAVALAASLGLARHRTALVDFGARHEVAELLRTVVAPAWLDQLGQRDEMMHAAVCDVLSRPLPPAVAAAYQAQSNQVRVEGRRAAVELLCTAERQQPRLVVVEDLHWAQVDDRPLVDGLVRATASCPLVVVLTARSDDDGVLERWLQPGPEVATLELRPLGRSAAFALAAALGVARSTASAAVARAGGNPLFLEELLAALAAGSAPDAVPGTVHNLVLARLDRVEPAARAVVQAASVLGQRCALASLARLVGVDAVDVGPATRAGIWVADGPDVRFRHALVRDGVYASLTRERRRQLHLAAAAVCADADPVDHARHLDHAGHPDAVDAYLAAARWRRTALEAEGALELAERALTLADADHRHAALMLVGELCQDLGRPPQAVAAFRAAAAAATSDDERRSALIQEAATLRLSSSWEPALAALDAAASLGPPPLHHLQIHYHRASIHFARCQAEPAREQAAAALALAAAGVEPEWQARALSAMGDAEWGFGAVPAAVALFSRCVELCRQAGLLRIAVPNRLMLAQCQMLSGHDELATATMTAAVADARRLRHRYLEMFAIHSLAMAAEHRQQWDEALDHLVPALVLARAVGAHRFEVEILTQVAECEHLRGGDGLDSVDAALALARRQQVLAYCGPWTLGVAARLVGPGQRRQQALADGEQLLAAGSMRFNHVLFYQHAIEAVADDGDAAAVERFGDALARQLAAWQVVPPLYASARARARLAR